jgi:SOS-response transcriptional repressor LexA
MKSDVLDFVRSYWRQHGYGPSVREIAEYSGQSLSTVHGELGRLQQAGKLTSTPGIARSWRATRR